MQLTKNQIQRLREIGCVFDEQAVFDSAGQRESAFKDMERRCIESGRSALRALRDEGRAPAVQALATVVSGFFRSAGFVEVFTPLIIPKTFLKKMTIDSDHALFNQVFWLDDKSCLRPMLAPGLYDISKRMLKVYDAPLGVFEIGPCFRKESVGGRHLETFTMVNFVEWGTPESEKMQRLRQLIDRLMQEIGLENYSIESEQSVVYGDTLDVLVDGIEVASGAFGPHFLDDNWGIRSTWLGLGVGLERIVMLRDGLDSIQKAGRSLRYLGGVSLNFK